MKTPEIEIFIGAYCGIGLVLRKSEIKSGVSRVIKPKTVSEVSLLNKINLKLSMVMFSSSSY